MGLSSTRRRGFRDFSFMIRPFDTKIITAGVGIPHMDIGYSPIME
jgi:hypothetical protein